MANKARIAKPRRRAEKKAWTKEKILSVALDLFNKRGFEQTSTKQIASKAGVAEGTIFNYFKTKDDLALFFIDKEIQTVMEAYRRDKRIQKASLDEKLFFIVERQLAFLASYEKFIGAVLFRAMQPGSGLNPMNLDSQALNIRYLKFIQEILETSAECKKNPLLMELGPYVFGIYYLGVLSYWMHDTSRHKEKTLALLDRSLKLGVEMLNGRTWRW